MECFQSLILNCMTVPKPDRCKGPCFLVPNVSHSFWAHAKVHCWESALAIARWDTLEISILGLSSIDLDCLLFCQYCSSWCRSIFHDCLSIPRQQKTQIKLTPESKLVPRDYIQGRFKGHNKLVNPKQRAISYIRTRFTAVGYTLPVFD